MKGHEQAYLKELKAKADGLGVKIHVGHVQHLPDLEGFPQGVRHGGRKPVAGHRVARTLGSPLVRVCW